MERDEKTCAASMIVSFIYADGEVRDEYREYQTRHCWMTDLAMVG